MTRTRGDLASFYLAPAELPRLLSKLGLTDDGFSNWSGSARTDGESEQLDREIRVFCQSRQIAVRAINAERKNLGPALATIENTIAKVGPRGQIVYILRSTRRNATLVRPDGTSETIPIDVIKDCLLASGNNSRTPSKSYPANPDLRNLIEELDRREHATARVFIGWTLDPRRESTLISRILAPATLRTLGLAAASHLTHISLLALSWVLLGAAVIYHSWPSGYLIYWVLAIGSMLVAHLLASKLRNSASMDISVAIRRFLLDRLVYAEPQAIRTAGIASLFASALEAGSVDNDAVSTAIGLLLSIVELFAAMVIVMLVPTSGWLSLGMFVATSIVAVGSIAYFDAVKHWRKCRLAITAAHTEELLGHRTSRVFGSRDKEHGEQISQLWTKESAAGERMDRLISSLKTVPRAWLVAGLLISVHVSLTVQAGDPRVVALVHIGIALLVFRGLAGVVGQLVTLVSSLVAYGRVNQHFGRLRSGQTSGTSIVPNRPETSLNVSGVTYAYPNEAKVIDKCSLKAVGDDKVLLTGSSGGGKSTLADLIAGRLNPDAGTILVNGFDSQSVGTGVWRSVVCCIPQSQRNHLFSATLAFNLLMGRGWPPAQQDMEDARSVCEALGLGALLRKLPAEMNQMVGEYGWQLSQGERARVFLARALLQNPKVLMLDEPFDSLDSANTLRVLRVIENRRDPTVIIAHI